MVESLSDMTFVVKEQTQAFDELAESTGRQLTEIRYSAEKAADAKSWEMATAYISAYEQLEEAYKTEYGKKPSPQKVNKAIAQAESYDGPKASWLADAKKLSVFCPDIFFGPGPKKLSYDSYRRIAVNSLPSTQKQALLQWAEETQPNRVELRQEIRQRVDAEKGISRPDFTLRVGNLWTFGQASQPDGFDGGIFPDVVANLLYYFTDPGDIVIDPMAGGDTTYKVTQQYKFFEEIKDGLSFSGPRHICRADLAPQHPDIDQCDIREGLPWKDNFADFCIFDPPYYKIADGKYDTFGETITEWRQNVGIAVNHIARVLTPGGCVAIITDDYLRSKEFHPLAFYGFQAGIEAGLTPIRTIYNTYANFVVTMSAAEMHRAKLARTQVNQVKIISVFEKPSND